MDPGTALWHLLNFVAPAFGVALLAAGLAKVALRRSLSAARFAPLALSLVAVALPVRVLGLWLTGRDGRIGTELAMVVACGWVLRQWQRRGGR